ncbi:MULTISPECIES: tripartite tricarboxylate transporter TctB family protein [unclassified Halomonas]|uniref:tripartite tricarboxylate transporter TctB family protein n=1 Tax=Halomonas TaxID=2745 RepID=UPI001C9470D4|nr:MULTISPECIES: tripartite tricarboxylate transporter TctB family protein [unclassified Halomonas]MBY5924305.1 tripartite tricarboxylate transporter TctB family protein [Halomonas sp. DP4Y7-2]MBY6231347.1 tripartite tricarboxylate transporter TctB family protein [Halomonas sp. DP4Y7-1]
MSRFSVPTMARALGTGAACFHGVLALMSLGYLIVTLTMGPPLQNGKLTPSFFPLLIGALASVLCLLQWRSAVHENLAATASDASQATVQARAHRFSPELLLMLATLVYVLAFQGIGYLLSTLIYVLTVMMLFSGVDRWLSKVAVAMVITGVGYLLFQQIFNVRLPALWG